MLKSPKPICSTTELRFDLTQKGRDRQILRRRYQHDLAIEVKLWPGPMRQRADPSIELTARSHPYFARSAPIEESRSINPFTPRPTTGERQRGLDRRYRALGALPFDP